MDAETVIVGAGPTGLSAAYHLEQAGAEYLLLEQADRVGGLCRSIERDGFIFDHAGHIMFTKSDYVKEVLYPKLLGDNVHWQQREAWAYFKGVYIGYPFQASLYGLPADLVYECLLGAAEAYYVRQKEWPEPKNFEEWIYRTLGDGIARHLMIPYNKKVWATPLSLMGYKWLFGSGGRVPQVTFADILHGALMPQRKDLGPNARFAYPLRGGFEALMRGFLKYIDRDRVVLNARVTRIDPKRKTVTVTMPDGTEEIGYRYLIVTMPPQELVKCTVDVPAGVVKAANDLLSTTVLCVNVAVNRPNVSDKHWIYYPDPEIIFQRIFVMSNASPYVCPPGTSSFIAEISTSKWKPVPREGLEQRVIQDAIRVQYLRPDDEILFAFTVELKYAYAVQDLHCERNMALYKAYLREHDIIPAGRFAEWRYINSDEAMLAGKAAAELIKPELAAESAREQKAAG
jgi:UDP-galactopyranose mutase